MSDWDGGYTFEGKYTDDIEEYLSSWGTVKEVLEAKLGIIIYGFNPDFGVDGIPGGCSFSMPCWFVKRLLKSWEK